MEVFAEKSFNKYLVTINETLPSTSAEQIEALDNVTTQIQLNNHAVSDFDALELVVYIEACCKVQKRKVTALRNGDSWNFYREIQGHGFEQLDLVFDEAASSEYLTFDLIGGGTGETLTNKYHASIEI